MSTPFFGRRARSTARALPPFPTSTSWAPARTSFARGVLDHWDGGTYSMRKITACFALLAVLSLPAFAAAATPQVPDRINDDQVKQILSRLDHAAASFRKSLDEALDHSPINGSRREDRINDFVKNFAKTTDRLKEKFDDDNQASGLARDVLVSAEEVDRFMREHPLSARAQDDWQSVRVVLDDLATAYSVSWSWSGEPVIDRVGDKDVKSLLARIETSADRFRKSLDAALDRSEINGTATEDELNRYIQDFERATDKWKSHFGDHDTAASDAAEVLERARVIDQFMAEHPLNSRAQEDWSSLRGTLDELARAYNVTWTW